MAKKISTEKEIQKSPEPDKKKEKSDSGKSKNDLKQSFEKTKQYIKESFSELKKIQWPGRKQVTGETIVVLITVVFMTTMVVLIDNLLSWVFGYILG